MTLTEFLLAQIAEDEADARAAANRVWLLEDNTITLYPGEDGDGYMAWPTRADAYHAANWAPRRVLAECEAKRLIVDLHMQASWDIDGQQTCSRCVDPDGWTVTTLPDEERWPCYTLRFLALPFADHPDYDEAWKP